jgi:hypothetical protein
MKCKKQNPKKKEEGKAIKGIYPTSGPNAGALSTLYCFEKI